MTSPVLRAVVRAGAYHDSVVLMQLQRALAALPGIDDAGVVMATPANRELLAASGLLAPEVTGAGADDLLVVLRAARAEAADTALARVDELLAARAPVGAGEYRPRRLAAAAKLLPAARWVLVSVPGRFAADVAREALALDRHVFLYSDNVPLAAEVELKRRAAERGLLVLGPDCGTAIVGGVGLGFANRVRRGSIGLVAASGTGLQAVACRVHELGGGISQALGTGGRDLSDAVGGTTTLAALDLLGRDRSTSVIVLISKPPAPPVARRVLDAASRLGKPVVVYLLGASGPNAAASPLCFAQRLEEAAELAIALAAGEAPAARRRASASLPPAVPAPTVRPLAGRFLRGLFAGGTLATEAQLVLTPRLGPIHSNAPLAGAPALADAAHSVGHTVLDLGADEFTVGRLHPMLDPELRLRRLRQEAADPATGVLLLDVVLGFGADPDPAATLAPTIAAVLAETASAGRELAFIVALVGTDEDPQDRAAQEKRLREAGARVHRGLDAALADCAAWLAAGETATGADSRPSPAAPEAAAVAPTRSATSTLTAPAAPTFNTFATPLTPTSRAAAAANALADLQPPLAALNVGLESFAESLAAQGAQVLAVDWRPPAAGNEAMAALLERLRGR